MKALIMNYRRGRHTQKCNHIILKVDGIDSREKAKELVNKEVIWVSQSGKTIKGKIVAPHGNKGAVRAIFERGLPGQAIATHAEIS